MYLKFNFDVSLSILLKIKKKICLEILKFPSKMLSEKELRKMSNEDIIRYIVKYYSFSDILYYIKYEAGV